MLAQVLGFLLLIVLAVLGSAMKPGDLSPILEEPTSGALNIVRTPTDSHGLNRDLDGLIVRILPILHNPNRSTRDFEAVVTGLDKVLSQLRKELDPCSSLFQRTTARNIAGLGFQSSFLSALSCKDLQPVSPSKTDKNRSDKNRFKFTNLFLRTGARSKAYWKVGALLMAITPVADLGSNDVRLLSTLFQNMPTENNEALARLAFHVTNRIPAQHFLMSDYDVLDPFYQNVLLRRIPAHYLFVSDETPDMLAHPGPVISCAPVRGILQILLLRCPESHVETITIKARTKLRPGPWARLFLHGALRVFDHESRPLKEIHGAVHSTHLLCALAVRSYRDTNALLLAMLTGIFTVSAMEYVPLSLQEPAFHGLVADLTEWYRDQGSLAIVLFLSHLDYSVRFDVVRRLLVMDGNDRDSWPIVEKGFWEHFNRLRFYGQVHFYLMGCSDLRPFYLDLDLDQIVRVVLAVAAWNEYTGPIPGEKIHRETCTECRMYSMDENIGEMIVNLLIGLHSTDLSKATVFDTIRFGLIQELIARSWVGVAEFEQILTEVFESRPFPKPELWVNALDDAGDRVALLTFSLFYHVLARWDPLIGPNELSEWRYALAFRFKDLDAEQAEQLREYNPSFFVNWPGSAGTPRYQLGH